jgi:hypothetical protein
MSYESDDSDIDLVGYQQNEDGVLFEDSQNEFDHDELQQSDGLEDPAANVGLSARKNMAYQKAPTKEKVGTLYLYQYLQLFLDC